MKKQLLRFDMEIGGELQELFARRKFYTEIKVIYRMRSSVY